MFYFICYLLINLFTYTSIQHIVHIRYCSGHLTVTYRVHVPTISRTETVYLSGSNEFTARLCSGVRVVQSLVVYVVICGSFLFRLDYDA